jgi:glycosyltransferase involved in cell wall biosynthesis
VGLKVLMIGAYPVEPGIVRGGIEAVTSTLVPALAERDDIDQVTVLRFHSGDAPHEYRREGPKVDVYYMRGQNRLRTITGSFLDLRKAQKLVAELKPDIVHGQEIGYFGDIAVRSSPNCVVTVHGMVHVESRMAEQGRVRDKVRTTLLERLVRRVLRRARVVISISKYDSQELDGMIRGSRVSIANPTAAEFFDLPRSSVTEPTLLFAGVLTPRKNVEGLLNAFARVRALEPAARLVMLGPQPDADYARAIRQQITRLELDDRVDMVGLVGNERLRCEIAGARAVVLFSREETSPTIIAQAMAAGKPVIATRVGGVAEMVSDGTTGFVVESEDVDALTDRLLTVLRDEELCTKMGQCGYDVAVSRYTPTAVARQTAEAYRAALR